MLDKEQRRQLASVRKLLRAVEWPDVQQGIHLLQALDDPQLWAVMQGGLRITKSHRLLISDGELQRRVRIAHRLSVAVWVAHHAGWLRDCTALQLFTSPSTILSDLRPLAGLERLTALTISCCQAIVDLAPLGTLTGLETLDLSHCEIIPTLAPLAGLPSLRTLNLSGLSTIVDLAPLATLPCLETLDLSYCEALPTLAPLAGLPSLRTLSLRTCIDLPRAEVDALRAALPDCRITA